jgi:hypothetical protein
MSMTFPHCGHLKSIANYPLKNYGWRFRIGQNYTFYIKYAIFFFKNAIFQKEAHNLLI